MKPTVVIEYCPRCGWLLRSAWMAQELLTTFADELAQVALKPSPVGGQFHIYLDEELVFDRKAAGHFPEAKELKQLIRDRAFPGKPLGHSDRKGE